MINDMRYDFENVGLNPEKLFEYAEKRQLDALEKIATELEKKILSLPIYPELKDWQIKKVCNW